MSVTKHESEPHAGQHSSLTVGIFTFYILISKLLQEANVCDICVGCFCLGLQGRDKQETTG